ncbi:hypothetical protein QE152_g26461 [Popillia japonica]|uniref:Uncharacterized protein n=1 Tax=Popillia japonica TaxID=7064 RepID=A0AAW1JY96_POPJA
MDHSVIEIKKRHYKSEVLRKLLVEGADEAGVLVNHKKMNLKDCTYMMAEAWSLEVSIEDVEEWMVCDLSHTGFLILSDEELIESVREESVEEEN